MTDKDIIKALHTACFSDLKNIFIRNYITGETTILNMDDILDLINRQQAEIERLEIDLEAMRGAANSYKIHYEKAKSEAIKEFAERLKKSDDFYDCIRAIGNVDKIDCMIDIIDNLVEEMVGENNG